MPYFALVRVQSVTPESRVLGEELLMKASWKPSECTPKKSVLFRGGVLVVPRMWQDALGSSQVRPSPRTD